MAKHFVIDCSLFFGRYAEERGKKKFIVNTYSRAVESNLVCSVNKGNNTEDFIKFLGCINYAELSEMVSTRVIPSFLAASNRHGIKTFNEDGLRTWFVSMVIRGMKFDQAKRYLGALHTVFKGWNSDNDPEDPFQGVLEDLATPVDYDVKKIRGNAEGLRRLISIESENEKSIPFNVFLYLLYDVDAEFEDIIRLPVDNSKYDCQQISDLISRIPRKKRATYAFPLNQGNTTDKKIIAALKDNVLGLLKIVQISVEEETLRDSIRSLWIANAIEIGIDFATIRGMMASMPHEYTILNLIRPLQLDEKEKREVICKVANHINDTTVRWFIMRMRPKVTPDIVREEIKKLNEDIYNIMGFYYPVYQTVRVDKNKKRTVIDNPYLPGILFIRLRSDKVDYVVKRVTKYAWCYKWSRNPDSPYSSMTQKQMEAFQMHIGRLTPDIRMQLDVREEPFEQDTEVVIAGGDRMLGHTGRITSVRNADGTRTYSLEITSNVSAKWTVADIDEVFLRQVETK